MDEKGFFIYQELVPLSWEGLESTSQSSPWIQMIKNRKRCFHFFHEIRNAFYSTFKHAEGSSDPHPRVTWTMALAGEFYYYFLKTITRIMLLPAPAS